MRLGAGAPLIYFAREDLLAAPGAAKVAFSIVKICAGLLLMVGLWTPVAGTIAACAGFWTFFSQSGANHVYPLEHMFIGVLGASLALLGPGAWSVDARLFGRKLFVTRPGPRRST